MVDWLQRAKETMLSSTSFVDTNYRTKWEDNIRAFNSKHHSGSKYNSEAYRYRSKVFRPKTRAAIRNNEAAAAAAFFSNNDVVSITAHNPNDPVQQASAELMKQLLQYRLTKSIKWFMTLIGGFQDTNVIGVVCSYQSWKYKEREYKVLQETETGEIFETTETEVVEDRPDVELIPIENLRFHPASDWTDPINASPYLIRCIPMFVRDVKERMNTLDSKTGQPKWKPLTDDEISSGTKSVFDSTRLTREDGREDKYESGSSNNTSIKEFDIVWVLQHFSRDDKGEDKVYFTLGIEYLLTDPVPIKDMYFTGNRPFAMGVAVIESHRLFPSAPTELGQNIQREINEITNSRLDNLKLVLNKRYFVKRGANVDLRSILRNVAGSITFVDNTEGDVKTEDFNDVTGSSYEEQNRLSNEYDELVGTFSQSSVAANRKLNETVGGMEMLRAGASSLIEYVLRTFSETWVKEVMWQLVQLEQKYETDEVILALAFEKGKIAQKYGIDEYTDELLDQRLTMELNIGIGATDPVNRVNQFMLAMRYLTEILKAPPPNLNLEEVQNELFGRLGYGDGKRFFVEENEMSPQELQMAQQTQEMQQIIADLQAQLKDKTKDNVTKLKIAEFKEFNTNLRKKAELTNNLAVEAIKLRNPVQGEKVSA